MSSLNWAVRPAHHYASAEVGKVIPMPGVEFSIRIMGKLNHPQRKSEYYLIGLEALGCSTGKSFDTREEVEAYIERQKARLSEYGKLRKKKAAVGKRMESLRGEWDGLSQQVFTLLEVEH